jgi:hypothetical protein
MRFYLKSGVQNQGLSSKICSCSEGMSIAMDKEMNGSGQWRMITRIVLLLHYN